MGRKALMYFVVAVHGIALDEPRCSLHEDWDGRFGGSLVHSPSDEKSVYRRGPSRHDRMRKGAVSAK